MYQAIIFMQVSSNYIHAIINNNPTSKVPLKFNTQSRKMHVSQGKILRIASDILLRSLNLNFPNDVNSTRAVKICILGKSGSFYLLTQTQISDVIERHIVTIGHLRKFSEMQISVLTEGKWADFFR